MKKVKYLILGAGPAGLTIANRLKELGEESFFVLEKESEAGGLCRSQNIDRSPLDIGGGHFLDVTRANVLEFLFKFMPESEWNLYDRDSRIVIGNTTVSHPIEANIWQMDMKNQVEYLKSIAIAGCNLGTAKPEKFIDWIYWKLGKKIAEDYMIPYNKKVFSENLNQLGTYWLEKLPNVSFEETLMSCLNKKPYGKQPGHAKFYYPKQYGYGEVWLRMAKNISQNIEYNITVNELNVIDRTINNKYQADIIINTIPWAEFDNIKGLDKDIYSAISTLKYSSIQVDYQSKDLNTKAHWIYYPNENLAFHRILLRHNFCPKSKGYWTETNEERIHNLNSTSFSYMNKYAYPLNMIGKPKTMKYILDEFEKYNIYGCGRWGEWSHYNSDVTVDLSLKKANILFELYS